MVVDSGPQDDGTPVMFVCGPHEDGIEMVDVLGVPRMLKQSVRGGLWST